MVNQKGREGMHIPALVEAGKVIVPEAWISEGMTVRTKRIPLDRRKLNYPEMYGEDPHYLKYLTAAEYLEFNPPTLAELRHAFFDNVAPGYREYKYLRGYPGWPNGVTHAEWTSTFLKEGKKAIETPERVFYDSRHKIWVAEGGKVTEVELPPDGWVTEYDKLTGLAARTSPKIEAAKKVFGNGASHFGVVRNGVEALLVSHGLFGGGLFDICGCAPSQYAICIKQDFDDRELEQMTYRHIGARSCHRFQKPDS